MLIQLPPQLKYDRERTEHFFKVLHKTYGDYDFALEVWHSTSMEQVAAKHIYVRFHGPGKLYGSPYIDTVLREFVTKFKKWLCQKHSVWAFFNNDM